MLEFGSGLWWAIEVKRSLSPSVSKGFHIGCRDVRASERYVVYPGEETYPLNGVENSDHLVA